MLMREIEAAAVAKHGRRAYGRLTKANWQMVLDASVDKYAEARHMASVAELRQKFPEIFP